jgi:hypothetical protein
MDLTDNEKRDAVKLIEAGKPLPDKYHFLLCDVGLFICTKKIVEGSV